LRRIKYSSRWVGEKKKKKKKKRVRETEKEE
jgi:hypothetical protein